MLTPFKLSSRFGFFRATGSGGATEESSAAGELAGMGQRSSVETIAQALRHALTGCELSNAQTTAVLRRIDTAITPQALWMLRPEIYELIARNFSQAEAQRRVNELLPMFEGWIPRRQLNAV